MDLESIKKHYRTLDDTKIKDIAAFEAKSLRPEVLPVLMEEIKRRNLPEGLLNSLDQKIFEPTEELIDDYCKIIQLQACPECRSKTSKLNGTVSSEVLSIIFITRLSKNLKIACPACLDEHIRKANKTTALTGWWAFPWGPIRTIQAFIVNSKMTKKHHNNLPNDILQAFVYENIGAIEAYKEDEKRLKYLLSHHK